MALSNLIKDQFFALVRGGIWDHSIPPASLFSLQTDWQLLFKLAEEQTLVAILWDGMLKLPSELLPERKLKMKWYNRVLQIEHRNKEMNESLCQLNEIFQEQGITPILLKGQGLAALYPNPLHRTCGDIDLYVGEENFKKANQIADQQGNVGYSGNHKHSHLSYKNNTVEIHKRALSYHHKPTLTWMENLISIAYLSGNTEKLSLSGHTVSILPAQINIPFTFLHLYHHFLAGGIGFRQFCDWALLLNQHKINTFPCRDFKKAWQIMGYIAVNRFGLEKEKVPFFNERYSKEAERFTDLIFAEGNFGRSDRERITNRPKNYLLGKIYSFFYQLRRSSHLMVILPYNILGNFMHQTAHSLIYIFQKREDA